MGRWFLAICTVFLALRLAAQPATPTPTPDEPALALARQIVAAPDEAARLALLAAAPAELREVQRLCRALEPLEYQLGLEGDFVRCEALAQFLLKLTQEQGYPEGAARAKLRLGNALRELGQPRQALALGREATDFWAARGDERFLAQSLASRAIAELMLADFQAAQRTLQQAVALAEKTGFKETLIPALNTLGNVYRQQGRPARALETFERARAVVANDEAWNMAFIFNNMGQCHEVLGEPDKAAGYVERALAIAKRVKFRPRVASAQIFLGEIRLAQGRLREASDYFREALILTRELQVPLSEARAHQGIARVLLRQDLPGDALRSARQAVEMYRSSGHRDLLAPALTLEGRCHMRLRHWSEARRAFQDAIQEVETVRQQVAGGEADAQSFLERQVAPYQELVALHVQNRETARALERAEQAKARVLRDLLRRGAAPIESFANPAETAQLAEHNREIARANRLWNAEQKRDPRDPTKVEQSAAQLRRARAALDEFRDLLRHRHPRSRDAEQAAVPVFEAASLERLRTDEKARTLWVEFVVTEECSFAFWPDAEGQVRVHRIELTRAELGARVEAFRRLLAQRSLAWRQPANTLYEDLLGPIVQEIDQYHRLLLVPDGALWELPFAALLDRAGRTLLERVVVQCAPSLELAAAGEARVAPRKVLLVANPAFGAASDFAPLPETGEQQAAIARCYAGEGRSVTSLSGIEARVERCLEALSGNDVLHFATHGLLNNAEPLASSLVLAQAGLREGEDGLLEARAILQRRTSAQVAVLEACETGRGRIGAGEGLLGLAWAFEAAGCRCTIVSQWKIESTSAGQLAVGLHRGLAGGEPPAVALRQAALEVRRQAATSHPFYWAPFVAIGRP